MKIGIGILLLLITHSIWAQQRVRMTNADLLVGTPTYQRLIGNVAFEQNNTLIYCDSAHFYRSQNQIEAYGHIRILDDSVTVTSNRLLYDGNTRIARLRSNVIFTKLGIATLFTDFLDYNRIANKANYFNGGKLVDSTNTLTSSKGYYDVNSDMASFKTDVVGVSPDYTLEADTLQYNSKSKIIYFLDRTTIRDKEGGIAYYQSGFYNTNEKISTISEGEIETPDYRMVGDSYFLDDVNQYYKANGNVVMTSKEENTLIFGDEGIYDKRTGVSKIYGHAYVAKVMNDMDTLFLSADTLVSIENNDPKKKRLLAYPNVKMFKSDFQGLADSVVYVNADSTIFMYSDPILWTDENQMTADSIRLVLQNQTIRTIHMVSNSFAISEDSLSNFNQMKGRRMTAYMKDSAIDYVLVEGNGESIYYALQETEPSTAQSQPAVHTTGLNKIICSSMRINFKEGQVNNISFYVNPDASFIPPHEWKANDKRLVGFEWRAAERPDRDITIGSNSGER